MSSSPNHTTTLYLVIHLGAWTYEFDPDKTFDGDFTLRDGSTLPAKFMDNTFVMGRLWKSEALAGA